MLQAEPSVWRCPIQILGPGDSVIALDSSLHDYANIEGVNDYLNRVANRSMQPAWRHRRISRRRHRKR